MLEDPSGVNLLSLHLLCLVVLPQLIQEFRALLLEEAKDSWMDSSGAHKGLLLLVYVGIDRLLGLIQGSFFSPLLGLVLRNDSSMFRVPFREALLYFYSCGRPYWRHVGHRGRRYTSRDSVGRKN